MHRAFYKFALRARFNFKTIRAANLGAVLLAALMGAGVTACAEDPRYPSLSKIADLDNILTPEERQKAVQDLQKQDQAHNSGDVVKTASK